MPGVPGPRGSTEAGERRFDAFGPRLHATAVYLKTFQALSYERLQKTLFDLFGLRISQGGLEQDAAPGATRRCRPCGVPPWWRRMRRAYASRARTHTNECDLARDIQSRMRRARDQLLTFASFPGRVEATNNTCERDLRPAVIQRKNTNGCRAMWSAKGEAAVRTVVATARTTSGAGTFSTVPDTIGA